MTMTEVFRTNTIAKPGYVRVAAPCHRCGGQGGWVGWAGYTCYRCFGNGQEPNGERTYAYPAAWTDEQVAEHVARREAQAQARRDRKAAKADAAKQAFIAANPVAALIVEHAGANSFLTSLHCQLCAKGELSEAQMAKAAESIERHLARQAADAAEQATAEPLPTGTAVTVEGEVITARFQDSEWGGSLKMLVKGNGWKVWSTVPSAATVEQGNRIRFVANVEASRDDDTFGIAKRPRKVEVLAGAA